MPARHRIPHPFPMDQRIDFPFLIGPFPVYPAADKAEQKETDSGNKNIGKYRHPRLRSPHRSHRKEHRICGIHHCRKNPVRGGKQLTGIFLFTEPCRYCFIEFRIITFRFHLSFPVHEPPQLHPLFPIPWTFRKNPPHPGDPPR